MSKKVDEPLIKGPTYAYECGYAAGLKEGERRERRATRRMVHVARSEQNHEHCDVCWYLGEILLEKLAARSKPAKRKGGRDGRRQKVL